MTDGYTAVYGADETSEVVVDLFIWIIVGFISFGALIVIMWALMWMKRELNV